MSCAENPGVVKYNSTSTNTDSLIVGKEYPEEIKRLGFEKQYDKTKWYLYCIHCDRKVVFTRKSGLTDDVTFSMLPLRFDFVTVTKDTVEINFSFYYKDIKLEWPVIDVYPYWGGRIFSEIR